MRQPLAAKKDKLRVVFMGSDRFSVPALEVSLEMTDVTAVFTQPDSRSGRGRKHLTQTPVKELAVERNVTVEQPEVFDSKAIERLQELSPDLLVVVAYGKILSEKALSVARLDSINVHASILPRHRGASPIATAILKGDAETGVTIMKMRRGVDTGEIICCNGNPLIRRTAILPDETAGALADRLAPLGGDALREAITCLQAGQISYLPQDNSAATIAPMLSKDDGHIDWSRPSDEIMLRIRAMTPWPAAYTTLSTDGKDFLRIVVVSARVYDNEVNAKLGEGVIEPGSRLVVGTGSKPIELVRIRPAGRGEMSAADFIRGNRHLNDNERRLFFCRQ